MRTYMNNGMQVALLSNIDRHPISAALRANPTIGTLSSAARARLQSQPGLPARRLGIEDPIEWNADGGIDRRRGSGSRPVVACEDA